MGATRRTKRQIRRGSTLYVLPDIDDRLPADLKNAIARRNKATVTGRCDCGARIEITSRAGGVINATMAHENDCPAGSERFFELLAGWDGAA